MTDQIPTPDEDWIRRALREAPMPELTDERIDAAIARARAQQGRRRGFLGVAVLGPVVAAVVVVALMIGGLQSSDEQTPSVLGVPTSTQANRASTGQNSTDTPITTPPASAQPAPSATASSDTVTPADLADYTLETVAGGFGFVSSDQTLACGVRLSSGKVIYGCQSTVPILGQFPQCSKDITAAAPYVQWTDDGDPVTDCIRPGFYDAVKTLPAGKSLTALGVTMVATDTGVEIMTVSGARYQFSADGLQKLS